MKNAVLAQARRNRERATNNLSNTIAENLLAAERRDALIRKPGSVFVNVEPPAPLQEQAEAARQGRVWQKVATAIAESHPIAPDPHEKAQPQATSSEAVVVPIETVFAEALPNMIEMSRWGRYIASGPGDDIRENTTYIYHAPCANFWELRNLAKGIFRDLGIRLAKQDGGWIAYIPIRVLTDKVFVDSGLAAVEKTLMQQTGIDPVAMLREIRRRQFSKSARGYARAARLRREVQAC